MSGGWRLRCELALWRHGIAWPAAALLAIIAAALYLLALRPGEAALVAARAELAQTSVASKPATVTAPPVSEADKLAAFRSLLAAAPQAGDTVRKMVAIAEAERIVVAQGDYQQQQHPQLHAIQVQVTQPVRASYPQLRRYAQGVLRAMPHASLDQISVRRDNVGQTQLEARIRWSLWLAAPAAASTPSAAPAPPRGAEPVALQALIARDELIAAPAAAGTDANARDLFATRNWNPPPPPAPVIVAAPAAPPVPYAFMGKKLEGDTWEIYLSRDEQTFIAREGQVLEDTWRVDKIAPPTLTLTYMPLHQTQILAIGDTR